MTILSSLYRHTVGSLLILTVLTAGLMLPQTLFARNSNSETDSLRVGVVDMPPFAHKDVLGEWGGISIDLLDMIARDLGRDYELSVFSDVKAVREAVSAGQLDIIPALAATEEAERALDLTQPYYRSGFAIAVTAKHGQRGRRAVIDRRWKY